MQLETTEGWCECDSTLLVYVHHVKQYVLTVCQCLNLLPKGSEIRLSESILSRDPLLCLKLQTHSPKEGDIKTRLKYNQTDIRGTYFQSAHH